MVKEARGDLF